MLCQNLPLQDRSSPSAVRIPSVTPPGVKNEAVFDKIKADITQGITEGFVDIDANGETRRIFLDLVCFVGDTPAINSALDVLVHNATDYCHVCRFRRGSSALVGSKYTAQLHHGSITSQSRGYYQHMAVRDSAAQTETCRLLGMKPHSASIALPRNDLLATILESRSKIPRANIDVPILSGDLDPDKSCSIAPDHLLSGHAQDCINLAFKLSPSKEYREVCESVIIGLLRDCELRAQNRIFNHEKKVIVFLCR